MEVVTSTRGKGEGRPLIVLRVGNDFHLRNNPRPTACHWSPDPETNLYLSFEEQEPWMAFLSDKTPLAPLSSARQTKPIASHIPCTVRRLNALESQKQ
jgi:hypothetical protein